jgi:hypothetical protein
MSESWSCEFCSLQKNLGVVGKEEEKMQQAAEKLLCAWEMSRAEVAQAPHR